MVSSARLAGFYWAMRPDPNSRWTIKARHILAAWCTWDQTCRNVRIVTALSGMRLTAPAVKGWAIWNWLKELW